MWRRRRLIARIGRGVQLLRWLRFADHGFIRGADRDCGSGHCRDCLSLFSQHARGVNFVSQPAQNVARPPQRRARKPCFVTCAEQHDAPRAECDQEGEAEGKRLNRTRAPIDHVAQEDEAGSIRHTTVRIILQQREEPIAQCRGKRY
jgi:hypothetical protein